MLKLKLSRSSSDLIGLNCQSSEDNEPSEIEALRIELVEKQYQLEEFQKAMFEEIQAVREEGHRRLVLALEDLRHCLHREKLAELKEQKKAFERCLEFCLKRVNKEVPRDVLLASDDMSFIDEDVDEVIDGQNCTNDITSDFSTIETAINEENLNGTDLSPSFSHESRAEEINNGREFSREIEKRLQNMQKPDEHHLPFTLKRKLPLNMWSHRDKFRSNSPYDLHSAVSIMTPIHEDKEEYDWFEERRQLLEENSKLTEKINAFEKEKLKLEIELQEIKDHNELLEFRILELEEFTAGSANHRNTKMEDKGINTDPWWDTDLNKNIPILLKLSKMKNLTETREERIHDRWEKLQTVDGQINSQPNVLALLQAAYMLELLTPISQEFALIKSEHAKSESEIKDWFRDVLEITANLRSDKMTKTEEENLPLHLENKPFLCKTPSIDKSNGFSMHSSMDSASEVSDISQGGETGYSSDESIDAEDLYQTNKHGYDFQNSYPSYEVNNPFDNSIVNDLLQKFVNAYGEAGRFTDCGNSGKAKDIKLKNDCNYSKLLWNPIDMMNRIQELEMKENKTRVILHEFQRKHDQIQTEKDVLQEKCLKIEESERKMKSNEENLKNQLARMEELEIHLQQNIAELKEKDNLSNNRIASLEKERDKLRSEATQLLQLLNLDTTNVTTQTNERSYQNCKLSNIQNYNKILDQELNKDNSSSHNSEKESLVSGQIICNCFNNNPVECFVHDETTHAFCTCEKKNDSLSTNSFCMQCKNSLTADCFNSQNNIECLHNLLNAKNHEIKNKETEYTLKIEALKCDLEETVATFEEKLETAQRNLYQLQERLESLSQSKDTLESNFKRTCADLQTEKTSYLEQIHLLQNENTELCQKLEMFGQGTVNEDIYESSSKGHLMSSLNDYKGKGIIHKKQLRELENHLTVLCREAEEYSKDKGLENSLAKEFFSGTEDDNLLEKIQEMLKLEAQLKQRVFELENKETAYKETLREADKIIANVERSYQERVEELEATEGKLRAKIVQLEQNEKRLRQTLKNANRNSEVGKFGELLDRLLESEASEQRLRDRIFELDQKEREQKQTIKNLEKEKEAMETELQEQEGIIQTVQSLKRTEKELRKQIEALETSECALQETLSQADNILAERENKLQNQMQFLECEIENLQQTNVALRISEKELKLELELSYNRIEELQEKLTLSYSHPSFNAMEETQLENSSELNKIVTKQKNDPVRLRQMSDLMETNGKLELQISELQSIIDKLHQRIFHLESEHTESSTQFPKENGDKQDLYLQMSLELLSKDSKIESLEDKIKVLEVGNILSELQSLSLHGEELKELKDKINSISAFIQDCNCCNCVNCRPLLHDIQSQVHLLDEIISGTCSPADSHLSKSSMSKTSNKIEEMKTSGIYNHRNDFIGKAINYKDKQSLNGLNKNNPSIQEDISLLEHLPSIQKQMLHMENTLKENKMQLENKEKEIENHLQKIKNQEVLLNKKTLELENMQNSLNSTQKKIEELQEKQRKSELSEQNLRDTLLRKKQDLKLGAKQIQQLEQQVSSLNQQLKRAEQTIQENNNYKDRLQELEGQLQKQRESERKLHADNLHLHHKVEAQRERINSLQLIKKEYKQIVAKYDMLEKQKKIADQAVTPLKNKVVHLTEKCKEKDQLILLFTKQQNLCRKNGSTKTCIKMDDDNNNDCNVLDDISEISIRHQKNSNFSSASSDPSDSSMESSSDNCLKSTSPRSRIPRYTALSSPLISPRLKQDVLNKNVSDIEMSPVQKTTTNCKRPTSSPKISKATLKKFSPKHLPDSNISPGPPTNFQVTRQISNDSLLVAWTPPPLGSNLNNDNAGYQIFVNGVLHQKVRSPGRTKALLNGLEMSKPLVITIHTVSTSGSLSPPSRTLFTFQTNDLLTNSEKKSNGNPSVNSIFNQNQIKQKFTVLQNYIPQDNNSSTHSYELNLKVGDTVTVFGPMQSNGFFFGEANGQRGLIPADVLQSKSSSSESPMKTWSINKHYAFVE